MLRSALPAVVTLFGAAAVSLAQPPAPPAATTAPAGQSFRVKQVLGSKISIQGNIAIGTVDDIVFNDSGYVEYLIVLNEGKLVTVPWEAAKFDFKAQTAVVNITQEKFRVIPTYTAAEYPNFYIPAYRTEIYRFYGITPRDRRTDRRDDRQDRRP